ncbi:complex I subunit 4 family protein [Desulforegula conservatrix]|uniref:complex I subunit 4 family protein n=1 Tax=Desulforegula conservatrix TaxID=153026 RepID=UPI000487F853|nr:NADH-quinone oxidoreductase subunit M [Desulforegula conservatrix]
MDQHLIYNSIGYPVLSAVTFIPLAGALVALFIKNETMLKLWGFLVTVFALVLSLPLYTNFDATSVKFQFAEVYPWFPALNLDYVVGVDGMSTLLVLLTTFIMPLCILCSWNYIKDRLQEFIFVVLLMETAMIGVFISLNTVMFYIFWEAMLLPMYLIIAVWGGPRKDYASIKFFLYTLIGSVFLLVAIIALYIKTGTFFIPDLMGQNYAFMFQFWIFLACALAFAIKIPMFPLHTWLPAAHVEAPTAGSVILASILLKMGGYGFLRLCLPITPEAVAVCAPYMIGISVVSILAGGYLALGQSDIKKLIAYSSVGHMGFVTLGVFLLNSQGIKGAMLQMINHGITTGALFICVGIIYERTHSREISANSALGMFMPIYVTFLGIFSLSSLAFPGTNSFVGEFLVLLAAFGKYPVVGGLAVVGAVLAAAYMLRLLQKMVWADSDGHAHHGHDEGHHGHEKEEHHLSDLGFREAAMLVFLTIFVFWIGLNPSPILKIMNASVDNLVTQAGADKVVGVTAAMK